MKRSYDSLTRLLQQTREVAEMALLACAAVGSGTWSGNTADTDVNPDQRCLAIQSFLEHFCISSGNGNGQFGESFFGEQTP